MEANWRWLAVITAWAPIAWGSTYFVTKHFLPAGTPLTGAVIRALPAGLILLAIRPGLPRGAWWWRALLSSALTVGGFFVLIYVAGQRLPSSVAAMLMATSAAALMLFAWPLAGERPRFRGVLGAAIGMLGVVLLLQPGGPVLDPVGIAASLGGMASSCLGFALAKRWKPPVSPVTWGGWQLTFGGLMVLPVALAVEGLPQELTTQNLLGYAYLALPATAVAYAAWFTGLSRLPAATVGLLGLLNPLSGALLGAVFAGETLSPVQLLGAALILAGVVVDLPIRRGGRRADRSPRSGPRRCHKTTVA